MATIKRMEGKHGISYKITVHHGYDSEYRKSRHYKTWKVPDGWSEKRAKKEAQKIALEFEQEIQKGLQLDNKQTFVEYANYVIDLKERTGTKHTTVRFYRYLMERIVPAIGHLKLADIRPQHLNAFYKTLMEKGIRTGAKRTHTKIDLGDYLKKHHITREKLAEQAGISHTTVTSACRGQQIQLDKAEKIAAALGEKTDDLFAFEDNIAPLSNKTVKEYHRFIRVVLAQAEKEMLVSFNAAAKAQPPKVKKAKVNYFQPDEIAAILEVLETEPLKWHTITHLLIVTGCRRGEIMGLKWEKVDWEHRKIKIDTNLLYTKEQGIYEDTTKTENVRYITLPEETMRLLRQFQVEQQELRLINGDRWQDTGFIFTQDDGKPMFPGSIGAWLNGFSKRHELPHINPHAFRHTVASVLIANGLDIVTVSKQLGHTKVSTTDDYYAHIIEEEKAKASECIADVMLRRKKA